MLLGSWHCSLPWHGSDIVRLRGMTSGEIGSRPLAGETGWDHLTGGQLTVVVIWLLFWFAVKVPLFPIHTGSRRPTEAPVADNLLMTGLMSKLGSMGLPARSLRAFGADEGGSDAAACWMGS